MFLINVRIKLTGAQNYFLAFNIFFLQNVQICFLKYIFFNAVTLVHASQSWTPTVLAATTSSCWPPRPPRRRASSHSASTTSCPTRRLPCVATSSRRPRALSGPGIGWRAGRRPRVSPRGPPADGTDDASRWGIHRWTPSSTWPPILRP